MARKPPRGADQDPITVRAAKITGKYTIVAAVVGAVVAAAAGVGFGLLAANGQGSASTGIYYSVDMTRACQTQHNDSSLKSLYENWNDPNSWVCVNGSGLVVGTINVQSWCDHADPGSTAVNEDNTAYGWRCRTLPMVPHIARTADTAKRVYAAVSSVEGPVPDHVAP